MYAPIRSIVMLLSLCAVNMTSLSIQDPDHYGPYYVNYTRFELCPGVKAKNATISEIKLSSKGHTFYGHFNLTYLVPTQVSEVKIMVYSVKNKNTTTLLWIYKLSEPCKHFAFASILEKIYKADKCTVDKGTYFEVMNFVDICTAFFGTSFFYGDFVLKISATSKNANIMCLIVGITFYKKTEFRNVNAN